MKYGVGIDISKGKSTVAILSVEGEIIEEPFEITHNIEGLNLLEEKMKIFPKENIRIVMEETGTYHLPVLGYLLDKDYFVTTENAFKIKKYLDRGLRKAKTDKKDAYKLAEYACENWYKLNKVRENDEIYDNLKFLSRQYLSTIAVQVKQKVNFSNLCDLLFPGYYQLLDDNTFMLGLEIFKKYFHPEIVKEKKEKPFIDEVDELARKLGHKGAGISLATKIYALAQTTISPRPNNQYSQLSATSCVDALIITIKTSNTIITEMDKLARELPEYDVINEIPGCGKKLTSRVIAEIGDINNFDKPSKLIAFAGTDPSENQSGNKLSSNDKTSKRGSPYLRHAIYTASLVAISNEPELRTYYDKKISEGKHHFVALAGISRKLLTIIYYILKEDRDYIRYDQINN